MNVSKCQVVLNMKHERTICIEQFIVCFRSFGVIASELENLGQESVSPVFDIGEHVVQRVLELEAAGQHGEQV